MAAAFLGLLISAADLGCNYRPVRWRPAAGIRVPIFENPTVRRMSEFDLTRAVVQRVQAHTPYQVNRADADLELAGVIEGFETPGRVEGRRDQVIVSDLVVTLRITLKDLRSGREVFTRSTTERAAFAGGAGETEGVVRAEVYERLARWTVDQLQAPW